MNEVHDSDTYLAKSIKQPRGHWLSEALNEGFKYSILTNTVLSKVTSKFQLVEVHQTDSFGRVLVLDGSLNVSEKDEFFYHENLVHVAACTHPKPVSALIVGGGDGGAAEELLKHACVESVTLVEIDQTVIDAARNYLQAIHRGVINEPSSNPKLRMHVADGFEFVKNNTEHYDLIILDLTDPGGPSTPLYTSDFYEACAARLTRHGILAMHIASPFAQQQRILSTLSNLHRVFPIVRPYLVTVPLSGGPWMMACASSTLDPAMLSASVVETRLASRGVKDLQFYNGNMHEAAMALPNFLRDALTQTGARIR
jgi:spermidine synthase